MSGTDSATVPERLIVDLSGPRRLRVVRIIGGTIYGERSRHPDGAPTDDPEVVQLGTVEGETVQHTARRWTVGEWTVVRSAGCSCGGRNRALRAFTPVTGT